MHAELSGAECAPADAVAGVVQAGEGAGETGDVEAAITSTLERGGGGGLAAKLTRFRL